MGEREIKNMFTALGVSIGTEEDSKALNLEKLRYGKIIIMDRMPMWTEVTSPR